MFGLFKSAPFPDSQLGEFLRSRGYWRGLIILGDSSCVQLVISGTRYEPDEKALRVAHGLVNQFPLWKPVIERALFEHYLPYAEGFATGELPQPSEPFPKLGAASQVWPHVSLVFVSVTPLDGSLTTEFGYTTAWDNEHTLGARFQGTKFLELCGSVVPA